MMNEPCIVLNPHTYFKRGSSQKQQSVGRHATLPRHIIRADQSLVLLLIAAYLAEAANTNFYAFGLT